MKKVILIALLLLSKSIYASGTLCDGCSDTSMENAAIALGSGEHLIVNFEDQSIKKYLVINDNLGGMPINTAIEQTVSSETVAEFNTAIAAKAAVELEIANATVGAGFELDSAWELAANTVNQNLVANYYSNNTNLVSKIAAY